jgi:hypothetical protein
MLAQVTRTVLRAHKVYIGNLRNGKTTQHRAVERQIVIPATATDNPTVTLVRRV